MNNFFIETKGKEELLGFLKVFFTIIVPPLYLWFLSTNPLNYNNEKTIAILVSFWALLIGVVFMHIRKDNSIEYKFGSIGTFIIPIIFCYLAYSISQIDLILLYSFLFLYLLSILGKCRQPIKNRYYLIISLGRDLLPFVFAYLSFYRNFFYQNTLFNVLIISTWFIVFLITFPYSEKIREKEKIIPHFNVTILI